MSHFDSADNQFLRALKIASCEENEDLKLTATEQQRTPHEWIHILRCDLEFTEAANVSLQYTVNQLAEQRDRYRNQRDRLARRIKLLKSGKGQNAITDRAIASAIWWRRMFFAVCFTATGAIIADIILAVAK